MKNLLTPIAAIVALSVTPQVLADHHSGASLFDEGAKLSVGLLGTEGGNGYTLGLDWQFNRYAQVSLNAQSHLSPDRFSADLLLNITGNDTQGETYYPETARLRLNDVEFTTTLRYPFDPYLAPYLELGVAVTSIKDITFSNDDQSQNDSTGTGDGSSDSRELVASFSAENYFKVGLGLQFALADAHLITVGAHAYRGSDDWSELGMDGDARGMTFAYEYASGTRLGYRFEFNSKDMSGDPRYTLGLTWAF
jgi:hypothetical protein